MLGAIVIAIVRIRRDGVLLTVNLSLYAELELVSVNKSLYGRV